MNIWTFLQVIAAALISALQMNIFLGAYMGMERGKRDRRYLLAGILIIFLVRIMINTGIQFSAPVWLRILNYLIGYILLFGTIGCYRKEYFGLNIFIYVLGLLIFDVLTITMSVVIQEVSGYMYNDTPVLYNLRELLIGIGVETLRESIGTVFQICFMRTCMPYKKVCRQTIEKNLAWIIAIAVGCLGLVVYFSTSVKEVDLVSQMTGMLIFGVCLAVGYYIYMFFYNIHQRKLVHYLEGKLQEQKQEYNHLWADYNELRDIKHDLYSYVHILDMAGAGQKEQGQIALLKNRTDRAEPTVYTEQQVLNLSLNHIEKICTDAGIRLAVQVEDMQINPETELEIGFILERMIHTIILLNRKQNVDKNAETLEKTMPILKLQIVRAELPDGNIRIIFHSTELCMKAMQWERKNRKEVRSNRQIVQLILDRYEGFLRKSKREVQMYLLV